MKGTVPQWITAISLVVTTWVIYSTRELGYSDGWVTAVATSVLAIAAVIGLAGILLPIRQEAARRRWLHLKKLITEVLDPVKHELESHYLAPVSRNAFLFDWSPNQGITLAALGPRLIYVWSPGPSDNSLFEKRYRDVKLNHFPAVIGHLENFRQDFDAFRNMVLEKAKTIEKELGSASTLPELGTSQTAVGGCYHGCLAVFIFNRTFVGGYTWSLDVTRDHSSPQSPWILINPASQQRMGWGTEQQMQDLARLVESVVAREGQPSYVTEAEELHKRLKKVLGELADIQTRGKLEGDCDATR